MPQPGRGQLDRQRQAVQPGADRGHRLPAIFAVHQGGPRAPGPRDEEIHGVSVQGRHPVLMLTRQAQHLPAGCQDGQAGTAGEQRGQRWPRRNDLLQVIEEQQDPRIAEGIVQAGDQGARSGVGQPKCVGDRRDDQCGLTDRGQAHECDPAGKVGVEPLCRPDRQPGLAHASRSGQGQQPHAGSPQQRLDLRDFLRPPDQGRQWGRQRRCRERRNSPVGCRRLTRFGLIGKQPEHGLTSISRTALPRRRSRWSLTVKVSTHRECSSHPRTGMRNLPHAVLARW